MKCIILAAGEGTRMRPLTLKTPKPLLEVLGKPLIEYHFGSLPPEIHEVAVVIGYLGEQIQEHLGKEFRGKKISYILQKEYLGTFHAVELAKNFVGDQDFLVIYADDLVSPKSIKECIKKGSLCMLLSPVDRPERFGIVVLNPDGTVKELEEKPKNPKSNLANCGPCVLNKKIFDFPPPPSHKNEYFLTDSIALMMKAGHRIKSVIADWWMPIGYPEDLKKAEEFLFKKVIK